MGSHIVAAFLEAGHSVRCTVRATSSLRWLETGSVETVETDLGREMTFEKALHGVRLVVHAAGLTSAPRARQFREVNTAATERLAEAAAEAGVERFVFVSSLAARGPDGRDGPTSPYGVSKREAEERLRRLEPGLPVVVLRPGGVYGPRDPDLVPLFRLASGGWVFRPASDPPVQPVYATDVARAAVRAAHGGRSGEAGFGPYPVADSRSYSWREIGSALAAALGRPVRSVRVPRLAYEIAGRAGSVWGFIRGVSPGFDVRRARDLARYSWTCDTSATRKALGWSPDVSLGDGIERTLRWYREVGWVRG